MPRKNNSGEHRIYLKLFSLFRQFIRLYLGIGYYLCFVNIYCSSFSTVFDCVVINEKFGNC